TLASFGPNAPPPAPRARSFRGARRERVRPAAPEADPAAERARADRRGRQDRVGLHGGRPGAGGGGGRARAPADLGAAAQGRQQPAEAADGADAPQSTAAP